MSSKKTFLACISGQQVTLVSREAGRDVERLLAEAMGERFIAPDSKISVLTFDRSKLEYLAKRLGYAPIYKIMVNENTTKLNVEQYDLLNCHVIIFKVIDKKVMMHGIEDGQVPRRGHKVDWKKITEENYGWNLGSGKILVSISPFHLVEGVGELTLVDR